MFGVLVSPPQSLAVGGGAAPHGAADVVVHYDHDACFGEFLHHNIEDLHGLLAFELGVGLQVLIGDHWIVVVHL